MNTSIELKNVSLDFIVRTGSDSLKKSAINLLTSLKGRDKVLKLRHSQYRALTDISLAIDKGDRLAILGRNGAGKSTLLRVLAGVYKPEIGVIKIHGEISSLFDVSLGLNQEASGYENIINLGVMRWHSREKAESIIADVEEFTELGEFLSQPVRTYSSGMQMKLAFAVATAIPPEILLIDEIIGVGDAHFMDRADKRISKLIEKSHALVLTSHSTDIVRKFCNKAIVLENGRIVFYGAVDEAIAFYSKQ